jgi:hypothetical protein
MAARMIHHFDRVQSKWTLCIIAGDHVRVVVDIRIADDIGHAMVHK